MPDDTERPATVTLTPAQAAHRNEVRRIVLERLARAVDMLERQGDEQTRLLPEELRAVVRAGIRERITALKADMASIQAADLEGEITAIYSRSCGQTLVWAGGAMATAGGLLASPGFAYRREIGQGIGRAAAAVASVAADILGAAASGAGLGTVALVLGGLWLLGQQSGKRREER